MYKNPYSKKAFLKFHSTQEYSNYPVQQIIFDEWDLFENKINSTKVRK